MDIEIKQKVTKARNLLNEVLENSNNEILMAKEKKFETWKNNIPETIYPLQEKYARLLVEYIVKNPDQKKYNFATGMQSGKSGFIGTAAKLLLLEELGYKMIYICSLSDRDYWRQCYIQFYGMGLSSPQIDLLTQFERSSLILAKPSELKKHFTSRKNEKYIIFWDECHFGDGKQQGVDKNLLKRLHGEGHITIGVSATSFSIQQKVDESNSEIHGDDAVIFAPTIDELSLAGYKGISSMVANNQLMNPEENLKLKDGLNEYINDAVKVAVQDFKLSKGKRNILFFRLPPSGKNTKNVLKDLKKLVNSEFKGIAKVSFQDVKKLTFGFTIPDKSQVIVYYTKGGLRAGKRMFADLEKKSLIPNVSMVWESSNGHVAASSQGLPGRFCNYVDNRHIKIYCDDKLLRFYAEYENASYDVTALHPEIFIKYGIKKLDSRTKTGIIFRERWSIKKLERISLEEFNTKYKPEIKGPKFQAMWSFKGKSSWHIAHFESWNEKFEKGETTFEDGFEIFSRQGSKPDMTTGLMVKKLPIENIELGFMVFDGKYNGNNEVKKHENKWDIDPTGFVLVFHKGRKIEYNTAGIKSIGSVFDRSKI